jgi:four helix bundle protein
MDKGAISFQRSAFSQRRGSDRGALDRIIFFATSCNGRPMSRVVKDFRTLKVWEKAHELALAVYSETRTFPREELYGLVIQIRRAAFSVPSNIAEGCGRGSDADFARCLRIAMGSASEVEYQLLLARDLAMLSGPIHERLALQTTEVKRMLTSLISKLTADG